MPNCKEGPPSRLSRRVVLKMLLGLSGILAFLPFGSYGNFSSSKAQVTVKKERIANLSQILPGSALYFLWPSNASRNLCILTRDHAGKLHSFSALCTHAGCTLSYQAEDNILTCGCHGSIFEASSGTRVYGPAPTPLTAIQLEVDKDDEIYALPPTTGEG